jgi:hypothetical protein
MFKTPVEFSLHIEESVISNSISHMEAVLKFCEDNFIDPAEIKNLISKSLKDKIEVNMQDVGMLPKSASLDLQLEV